MKYLLYILSLFVFAGCSKNDVATKQSLKAESLSNVSYGGDPAQIMDVYLPAGRTTDSTCTIVIVHGGAWVSGDKSDFSGYISKVQQLFPGYAIANINYRLATAATNHFPTQENDMKAALDFLVQQSVDYHISEKFVLLGASAGGHMALLQAYKYASPSVEAVVDFFGPADMTGLYEFYPEGSINRTGIQILMNGTPSDNATLYTQSSPIHFVSTQSAPTIIFHGTADDVVPVEQSEHLSEELTQAGVNNQLVTYPNVGHEIWSPTIMNDAFSKMQSFVKANVH